MSLLLQALQKAARSRETSTEEPPAATPQPVQEPSFDFELDAPAEEEITSEELTLADEDLFEPEPEPAPEPIRPTPTRPGLGGGHGAAFATGASAAHAATILRASEERSAGWLDRVRDRPVHTFAAVAGVFLLFYGVYVYLQIFHPGILRGDFLDRPPLKAKSPPPAPSPISRAPTAAPPEAAQAPSTAGAGAPVAPGEAGMAAPMPTTPGAGTGKPIAGLPQGQPPAATEPARPAASAEERVRPTAERVERGTPPAARSRGEAAPRREVARTEPTDALEDTVAVRQPDTPALAGATLMQAWEALRRGQFDQAQALYQRVEEADPQNVDVQLGLAAIATQRGNTELAIEHYSRAIELEPRNPTAQAGLISLLGQADPQLSESRLKQLIAREPSANLYFALGNLYARMTQWAQAQQAYFQAYQLQPDNPDYAYNLAVGLEHLSQPKLALTYYRQAVELGNLRGHASFDTARVQERIGQLTARIGSE
jgi:Flp pilus assembly protein TadD